MKRFFLIPAVLFIGAIPLCRAAESAEVMMHATFKFFNQASTATCFLIQDQDRVFLISAAHTFENADGANAIIVLREGDDNGGFRRKDVEFAIRDGKRKLWTKHPTQDVAVIPLTIDLPMNATLPVSAIQAEGMPGFGDRLTLLTYPARVEANNAAFPLARQAMIASFPAAPLAADPVLIIDVNSWDGDSGGPVFREDGHGQPKIIGIVIERINQLEEVKSSRETRKIETPMGLSKAIHASLILETIQLVATAGPD